MCAIYLSGIGLHRNLEAFVSLRLSLLWPRKQSTTNTWLCINRVLKHVQGEGKPWCRRRQPGPRLGWGRRSRAGRAQWICRIRSCSKAPSSYTCINQPIFTVQVDGPSRQRTPCVTTAGTREQKVDWKETWSVPKYSEWRAVWGFEKGFQWRSLLLWSSYAKTNVVAKRAKY